MIELDHIFICVARDGIAEAAQLAALGLKEGSPNSHPDQGTSCRRFFFQNAYIELLWVNDSVAAQSELTTPTRLWERWAERSRHACPFGFGFRTSTNNAGAPPFGVWDYRPRYIPEPLAIQIANNSDIISEPMIFHLPFAQRPGAYAGAKRQLMEHPAGLREISSVELITPHPSKVSPEVQVLVDAGLLRLREGSKPLVELRFDRQIRGKRADFRPSLPLIFNW